MTHKQTHEQTNHGTNTISGRRPDDERARRWLESQLEWEQILMSLRDAGETRGRRRPPGRESAAA